MKEIGQEIADMPASLNGNGPALYRVVAVVMLGARLDPAIHAERGYRGRIARLADQTGDMIGLRLDELHVAHRSPDVLRGDVAAAECLHVPPVRAEDRLAVANLVVTDDH